MNQIKSFITLTCLIIVGLSFACGKAPVSPPFLPLTDDAGAPPKTWQEHWFEHNQLVSRVYYNENVAVYFDKDVSPSLNWPFKVLSDTWAYVKKTYGNFGDSTRLYVILHQGRYGGGHPASYFDQSHDYRNMIDCGLDDWTSPTGQQIGMPIHEIGHIVCGASHGAKGSPSDVLWGDSKFMEIFNYDVLMNIGREDEAARVYQQMQMQYDDFPRPQTQWFKNWFYPIYNQYGKAAVLNRYFALLAANFPKRGQEYTRNLNWGEFIHFWSGAAGINLKDLATQAFGWSDEWERQFQAAKAEFPNVTYKG